MANARAWAAAQPPRLVWALLGLLGVVVEFFRIGTPSWNRDEWAYANAGYAYIRSHGAANREHPPFAKLLIGASEHVFGFSTTGARIPAALAALGTGIGLALIAYRLAGRLAAVLAFGLWVALPHPTPGLRVDRLALLDCFAACFATLAVWAALRVVDDGRSRMALLCGALCGLAAASKIPGAAVLVPVLAFTGVRTRSVRGVALISIAAIGVFFATYLPVWENPFSAVRFMWRFQQHESAIGFPLRVAGHLYQHPPWWTAFWFAWHTGPLLILALVIAGVIGLCATRPAEALLVAGWLVAPALVVLTGHGRYFEHYAEIWHAQLVLVAALGVAALAVKRHVASTAAALVLAAPLVFYAGQSVSQVASVRRGDYALVGDFLRRTSARTIEVSGAPTSLAGYVCRGTRIVTATPAAAGRFDAIAVDPASAVTQSADWRPRELQRYPGRFRIVTIDGLVVYVRRGVAATPTCRAVS